MQRDHNSVTATLYITNPTAIAINPAHTVDAVAGALFTLIDMPRWSVSHHCTEK